MSQFASGGGYDAIQQFLVQRAMADRQRMLNELMQRRGQTVRRALEQMMADSRYARLDDSGR